MATSFSCNQYDQAFNSKRLVNWERPHWYRRKPLPKEGFTQFIAGNRGHLLPAVIRSPKSPWGTFVGTWDLPKKIPGNKMLDPTSRTEESYMRNMHEKCSADTVIRGKLKVRRAAAGQPALAQANEGMQHPDLPPMRDPAMLEAANEKIASPTLAQCLKPGSGQRLSPNVTSPKIHPASRPASRPVSRPMSQGQRMSPAPATPKPATPRPATPRQATPRLATPMKPGTPMRVATPVRPLSDLNLPRPASGPQVTSPVQIAGY